MKTQNIEKEMSLVEKRKVKAKKAKLKKAGRAKLTENRAAKRAVKYQEKTDNPHAKIKSKGSAPTSAKVTPAKGVFQKLAAKTKFYNSEMLSRNWLIIDAADLNVGRLASEIAVLLRGKHKAEFTPNSDTGDFVVVVNAEKVKFSTAAKEEGKTYYRHTGWMGGLKSITAEKLRERDPQKILENAVKGMLPKTKLGRAQIKKLKIYTGESHPHTAQEPVAWNLRHSAKMN